MIFKLFILAFIMVPAIVLHAQEKDLPAEFKQILPRGQIAAITQPKFVPAEQAKILTDSWVLGVVIDGQARAYSLNLLNIHEVVNDRVGNRAFAAVWCPLANAGVVYDRHYEDKTLTFEASGGLLHSALVMQDRETDSYWPIMLGEAIAGEMKGTKLKEIQVAEKVRWRDWVKKHPETLVLSANGREDGGNPYQRYFESKEGFRGAAANDRRLDTKEPIFAFHYQGKSYAVPHQVIESGKVFAISEIKLFLYRPPSSEIFYSTAAFVGNRSDFERENGEWYHVNSGCRFNTDSGAFEKGQAGCPQKFQGFDTFWYNWSLSNPDTRLLK